jgi:hypothetical protein
MPVPTAAGVALHGGWAIAVSVTTSSNGPVVIDRRRLELAAPGLPSHPYHHEALELGRAEGEALIREVREAVLERTRCALRSLRNDLAASFNLAALALRESRPLPGTLAAILASRSVYIADSEMYRDAMHDAGSELGLKIFLHPKDREFEFAAEVDTDASDVAHRIRNWRKALGPPWQKDHHAAAAAAIGALARLSAA